MRLCSTHLNEFETFAVSTVLCHSFQGDRFIRSEVDCYVLFLRVELRTIILHFYLFTDSLRAKN